MNVSLKINTQSYSAAAVPARESGSALIISLIMLLLLSLIGLGSMQNTVLQDRMTGNLQDQELAFQAAEAALREAEGMLRNNPPVAFPDANGLYRVNSNVRPDWPADLNDTGNGVITYGQAIPRTSARPIYYIEEIDSIIPPGVDLSSYIEPVYYRVTALGYGGSQQAVAVISTVFKKK